MKRLRALVFQRSAVPIVRAVRCLMSLAVAAALIAGCAATAKINLDPQVRKGLGELGVIRAVHYSPCSGCGGRREGLPVNTSMDPNMGRPAGYLPVEDPVKAVKDRFLAAVSQELGLTNLRIIDQP